MPSDPTSQYHHVIIALDDAIMALRDVLDMSTSAAGLSRRTRDRLTAMVAEMEEIQDRLEHNPRGPYTNTRVIECKVASMYCQ
jgi:hypothetical protein